MSDSRIIPDPSDFDELDPQLTDDERDLISFLNEHLPSDWTIYVRPHLNGEWPSVVVLHPTEGLVIYDVLGWEKGQFEAVTEEVIVNGRSYNRRRFVPTVKREGPKRINPRRQAERYRDNLLGIYLPRLGEAVDDTPKYIHESIAVGLYCPNFTTAEAREKFGGTQTWCTIVGHDHLTPQALENLVVPVMGKTEGFELEPWADRLEFFLNPPFHSEEEGQPVDLTSKQEKYAQPRPGTHRRLKGSAGSGKTLVLAQRAARNAAKGDHVLVIYYNITLGHYIRQYIQQAAYSFNWSNIDILHFHGFCGAYFGENYIAWPNSTEENVDRVLTKDVPKRVVENMEAGENRKNREYDAILIDEGQDFDELWFEALNKFLVEDGEVLLVADERQNIYDRVHSFGGMQFSGPWGSLERSYRMPSNLVREVNRFAESFVEDPDKEYGSEKVLEASQQAELGFAQPKLSWTNVSDFHESSAKALEVVRHLTSEKEVHPEDIVLLVPRHEQGRDIVSACEERGFETNHIFGPDGPDRYSRKRKQAFIMDDGRLKVSTIHSFKGWELVNVILITPQSEREIPPKANLDLLLYTAITRAQNSLFVFNQHPKYKSYGGGWASWLGQNVNE